MAAKKKTTRRRRAPAKKPRRRRARKKAGWFDIFVPISPQLETVVTESGSVWAAIDDLEESAYKMSRATFGWDPKTGLWNQTTLAKTNLKKSLKRSVMWWLGKKVGKAVAPGLYEELARTKFAGRPLIKK